MEPITVRVFISSTWLDLGPERKAVEACLQRMRETKFVGMEYFGSRDESTLHTSLNEVARSHVYVGIFGGRYGSGITEAEYRRAREQKLQVFIYIKDEAFIQAEQREMDSEAEHRLSALKEELRTHTVTNFSTPNELTTKLTTDLHRWLFDEYLAPKLEKAARDASPEEVQALLGGIKDLSVLSKDLLSLLRARVGPGDPQLGFLLDKVKKFWIEKFLKESLHGLVQLELGKMMWGDVVDPPWKGVVELPGQENRELHPGEKIIDIFDKEGKSLLILGEPGSGKTITLIGLAESLSARAVADPQQPVPVIFNLSTWGDDHPSLENWLVEELGTKYQVSKETSPEWLKKNRLVLLLDGLDEIKATSRAACIDAINTFQKEKGVAGIAVCSRVTEYTALPVRLHFSAAVCLQPLSIEQVEQHLAQAGPQLSSLRDMLTKDKSLMTLAQSPLVLNLMSVTYKNALPGSITLDQAATPGERLRNLMEKYVDRMFERMSEQPYRPNQVMTALSWLARQMTKHSQTVFLIETLQPTWLSSRREEWIYWIGTRLTGGVILAFFYTGWFVIMMGEPPLSLRIDTPSDYAVVLALSIYFFAAVGLCAGMIDGKEFPKSLKTGGSIKKSLALLVQAIVYGLAGVSVMVALGLGLKLLSSDKPIVPEVFLFFPLLLTEGGVEAGVGSFLWMFFAIRSIRRTRANDILMKESLKWSWERAGKGYRIGLALAIICTLSLMISPLGQLWREQGYRIIALTTILAPLTVILLMICLGPNSGESTTASFNKFLNVLTSPVRKTATRKLAYAQAIALIISVIILLTTGGFHSVSFVTIDFLTIARAMATVTYGCLVAGQFMGLFGALFAGARSIGVDRKTVPNQGTILTIRNSFVITLSFVLWWVIYFTFNFLQDWLLLGEVEENASLWLVVFPNFIGIGGVIGLCYGFDVVQHYVLRSILRLKGRAPGSYVTFLDYATRLIFLQKVGGGYIFIHRLVMDHFANLAEGKEKSDGVGQSDPTV